MKTLHLEKHILTEEECRRIGRAGAWWDDELARAVLGKPPDVVQHTLDVLEEFKEEWWYSFTAKPIKGLRILPYTVLEMNDNDSSLEYVIG